MAVDIARFAQRGVDGVLGDLVEHHALDRHLGLERLHQMPCDGLALAILISRQVELVGALQGGFQLAYRALLIAVHDVVGLEPIVDVHAELAELGFIGRGHLAGLRKVANMADRCHDGVSLAQIVTDFVGLGRGLHNHELGSHALLLIHCVKRAVFLAS